MANQTITQIDQELAHYGVLGMKWGIRKSDYKTSSLSKKVAKTIRKYDKGKELPEDHVKKLSRKVRKQRAAVNKRIAKAEKWLDKAKAADVALIINKYNKDSEKRAGVEKYLESMKVNATTLSELRMDLIDIRV